MTMTAPRFEPVVCIALDAPGAALARTLADGLGGVVHGRRGRVVDCDVAFDDTAGHLRDLFTAGHAIVGVMATGILVRALAPVLSDKKTEPPVVAVAATGAYAVPILGGHRGANALARDVAGVTGGAAAVTTASDAVLGVALDDPPVGWHVANVDAAAPLMARALAGETVAVGVEAGNADWLLRAGAPFAATGDAADVIVTDRTGGNDALVLHPPTLAVGVGCERGADADEVIALAEQTLAAEGLARGSVAVVVSIDVKADEAAVHALARHFGVPARFFDAETLAAESARLENPSDVVLAEVGCPGVAEGAALAAVGAAGALVQPKTKSARATCAIARSKPGALIDGNTIGRAQGRLTVVGIGPGSVDWRTGAAAATLRRVSDVVGYGLYLDLISDLTGNATRHTSNLAEEEARVRMALDLAAEGKDVALVSSGDAGIFALATLAFELLDREDDPRWNRLDVSVVPGVSAFQAAAARIGAPMGHDFCAISLSDLLTPWDAIQNRLDAAGRGDFVVALYNPVSKRRRHQIEEARDSLLRYRPADVPVVLARNLGRADEHVRVITLGELTADHADMLTMVVIGSSNTKHIERGENAWVYTPRGYAKKMDIKKETGS